MSAQQTTEAEAEYYKFDIGNLDDELYHPDVPVQKWLSTATTAGADGFPNGSLNRLSPITRDVELERLLGISLYMIGNVLPFVLPGLCFFAFFFPLVQFMLWFVLAYVGVLASIEHFFFKPWFMKKYKHYDASSTLMTDNVRHNQYSFTERNITKYLSVNFVWPKTLHRPSMESTPMIFCAIPHGVAPLGITAYPLWSKLWNNKICHWAGAPVLFKIPIIGYFITKMGYIPAKSQNILETLTKKEENVGIILDGIAGMFQAANNEEIAHIKARKGIVKIALRAGAPIVPVYGFGHTKLWTVVVDPFGALEKLSHVVEASITPFFGRFGWFLGPPRRVPVTVCLGEPVMCPRVQDPTKEQIDKYHQQLLESYQQLFDKHKAAYGWGDRKLKFV
jgi:1-acyl-sn-glycerol-3-phosphate acyltransferase